MLGKALGFQCMDHGSPCNFTFLKSAKDQDSEIPYSVEEAVAKKKLNDAWRDP